MRRRDTSMNVAKVTGHGRLGKVHAQARSGLTGYRVLFCTGQAVSMMVGTVDEVTCRACRKALTKEED